MADTIFSLDNSKLEETPSPPASVSWEMLDSLPQNTQTEALLSDHLPKPIVGIVLIYFRATTRLGYAIAVAGEYEECITTTALDTSLLGACIGGWIEIVLLMLQRGVHGYDYALKCAELAGRVEIVNVLKLAAAARHASAPLRPTNGPLTLETVLERLKIPQWDRMAQISP